MPETASARFLHMNEPERIYMWKTLRANGTVPVHYFFHSPRAWILDDENGAELFLLIEAIGADDFAISCRRVWESRSSYMIVKRNDLVPMVNEMLYQIGYILEMKGGTRC